MKYNPKVIRSRYQMVPRSLVLVRREDQYLLIHKRKEDSFGFGKLNGIGGHIEKGEEPYESALREIKEETGLDINDISLVAIIFIDIGTNPGIMMFVFSAAFNGGKIRHSEEGELVWMSKAEIEKSENIVKDLPLLIELVENHKPGKKPEVIKYLYDENQKLRIVL